MSTYLKPDSKPYHLALMMLSDRARPKTTREFILIACQGPNAPQPHRIRTYLDRLVEQGFATVETDPRKRLDESKTYTITTSGHAAVIAATDAKKRRQQREYSARSRAAAVALNDRKKNKK